MAYRTGYEYDEMAKLAIDLYLDYNLTTFPIDPYLLACKMGINVIPYSDLEYETRELQMKFSEDASNFPHRSGNNYVRTIYFNDFISSKARIEVSVLHEIKHIVNYDCETEDEEENKKSEEMADYFAKYMKCPIPYLVYKDITNKEDIMVMFHISEEMAGYVRGNVINRISSYGHDIFAYELPLLELLLGEELDYSKFKIIKLGYLNIERVIL